MDAGRPDFDKLEEYFRALSYATRLELLHELRLPRALSEIRMTARQVRPGQSAERPMSRQALEEHLARLVEVGVVAVARDALDGRGRREFVVNAPRIYQIMEEFRRIGTILPTMTAEGDPTEELGQLRPPPSVEGPHLVVVHGLREGQTFPLHPGTLAEGRGWVVGRKPGLPVALEYDPYVSLENSEIRRDGARHSVHALESSRNGTWLNWRRVAPGEPAALRSGDVLGFGRSLLVFRDG